MNKFQSKIYYRLINDKQYKKLNLNIELLEKHSKNKKKNQMRSMEKEKVGALKSLSRNCEIAT